MTNMTKNQRLLGVILGAILVLSAIAATYAYFTASLNTSGNTGIVDVTTTRLANLTLTSTKSDATPPIYPGWVGYQGIDVYADNGGSAVYDLSLLITGGENVKEDVLVTICKVEDSVAALSNSDFTFTAAEKQTDTSVNPVRFYMQNGSITLPSPCTSVVSSVTLASLGDTYQISTDGGKTIESGKHDKYYISYIYESKGQSQTQGQNFIITPTITVRASAIDETPDNPNISDSNINSPKLVDNLIPVIYDENTSKWVMISSSDVSWYNYDEQKWANAVTVKESKRGTYSVGDTIEINDILGMWVWIPRYEYKYTNLGNQYAGGTQAEPGEISINFIKGTSTTETTGYIIHPAFRDASSGYTNNAGTFSAWQLGGWDSELTGFWMGKFETSSLTNQNSTTSSTDTNPIVKPNVFSRRNQMVSHKYETALNIKTYHGISTLDSHMSKNSEWGAVVYLTQSIYGKYGNSNYSGLNKEVYVNNSNWCLTGRSMGEPASNSGSTSLGGSFQYNVSLNGTGASTTGNIYGIYDMAGGSWEYQMGWLNTASSNFGYRNNNGTDTNDAGFSDTPTNHRYYEEYTNTTISTACGGSVCFGQGLSETLGWYGDYYIAENMVSTIYPWFARGGAYYSSNENSGGIFGFGNYDGSSQDINSARAVLV